MCMVTLYFEKVKMREIRAKIMYIKRLDLHPFQYDEEIPKFLEQNNTIFLIRYKLLIENGDYLVDSVRTLVKFKRKKKEKIFKEFYAPGLIYKDKKGLGRCLDIPFNSRIVGHGTFKADIGYDLYSTIYFPEDSLGDIEYLKIELKNLKGKKLSRKIKVDDDYPLIILPENYWSKMTIV